MLKYLQEKKENASPGLEEAKWKQIHGGSGKQIEYAAPLKVKRTYSQ